MEAENKRQVSVSVPDTRNSRHPVRQDRAPTSLIRTLREEAETESQSTLYTNNFRQFLDSPPQVQATTALKKPVQPHTLQPQPTLYLQEPKRQSYNERQAQPRMHLKIRTSAY